MNILLPLLICQGSDETSSPKSNRPAMMKPVRKVTTLVAGAILLGAAIKKILRRRPKGQAPLSPLAHLQVGRSWEYEVKPGNTFAATTVVESLWLPNGRQAFRLEYRKGGVVVDVLYSDDEHGRLLHVGQGGDSVAFRPPVIALGALAVGETWESCSRIVTSEGAALVTIDVVGRVVGRENVTSPAGTFAAAYKVETVTNGRRNTAWHVPGVGMIREVTSYEELLLTRVIDADPAGTAKAAK